MGRFARRDLQPGLRDEMHQIRIALLILGEQHDIAA